MVVTVAMAELVAMVALLMIMVAE
jgi:hypothetical protein